MEGTSRALGVQGEADANLQNHFQSIQSISDSTTLPQMLVELARGLDRAANVDVLIAQLRYGVCMCWCAQASKPLKLCVGSHQAGCTIRQPDIRCSELGIYL